MERWQLRSTFHKSNLALKILFDEQKEFILVSLPSQDFAFLRPLMASNKNAFDKCDVEAVTSKACQSWLALILQKAIQIIILEMHRECKWLQNQRVMVLSSESLAGIS